MFIWIVIVVSAIWVFFDARSLGVRKGLVSGLGDIGPLGWGLVTLAFWIVGFPMYLFYRPKFKSAIAGEKNSSATESSIVARPYTTSPSEPESDLVDSVSVDVVITGLNENLDPFVAKENLAKLFKCNMDQVGRILDSAPYIVKKNVTESTGNTFKRAIEGAGGKCAFSPNVVRRSVGEQHHMDAATSITQGGRKVAQATDVSVQANANRFLTKKTTALIGSCVVILLVGAMIFSGKDVPKCDDPEVLDLVKSIAREQVANQLQPQMAAMKTMLSDPNITKGEIDGFNKLSHSIDTHLKGVSIGVETIMISEFDKDVGKYRCSANMVGSLPDDFIADIKDNPLFSAQLQAGSSIVGADMEKAISNPSDDIQYTVQLTSDKKQTQVELFGGSSVFSAYNVGFSAYVIANTQEIIGPRQKAEQKRVVAEAERAKAAEEEKRQERLLRVAEENERYYAERQRQLDLQAQQKIEQAAANEAYWKDQQAKRDAAHSASASEQATKGREVENRNPPSRNSPAVVSAQPGFAQKK